MIKNDIYSGIYEILNLENGKRYVGSSKNIYVRFRKHLALLNRNFHPNKHLQGAFIKYGGDSFQLNVLCECDEKELLNKEQYFIDLLRPEYNQSMIAGRIEMNQQTKEKISIKNKGRVMSDEQRKLISKTKTGRKASLETKEKMSIIRKANPRIWTEIQRQEMSKMQKGNQYWLGKKHLQETKDKISKSLKGHVLSDETKNKISKSNKGRKGSKGFSGRKHKPESNLKRKISFQQTIEKRRQAKMLHDWSNDNDGKFNDSYKTSA